MVPAGMMISHEVNMNKRLVSRGMKTEGYPFLLFVHSGSDFLSVLVAA